MQNAVNKAYRPDIDGLRAIAVMAVVLYHAQLPVFSGGYVGVDVFFVISGFLITSIIHREFSEHRFSFVDFYFRRVRRIFPALYVMCFSTIVAGFFLTFPRDFLQLGRAAKYIAFFSSNHLFWHTQHDYWAQNLKASQPLLHTWSLAVEEQFYIFIPILLVGMFWFFNNRRMESKRVSSIVFFTFSALALISLVYSQWLLSHDPSGAFYILPSRAWELLFGALIAVGFAVRIPRIAKPISEMMSLFGIGLIGYGIFAYSHDTAFPGIRALAPCLGTALVIFAGSTHHGLKINRLLGSRPFVFLGLLSYSLYLWHWPIFIFARAPHWAFWGIPHIPIWIQLMVVFALTYLSWRFVEEPFKHWKTTRSKEYATLGVALIAMIALSALGTRAIKTTYVGADFVQPIPTQLLEIAPLEKVPYEKWQASVDIEEIKKNGGGMKLGSGELSFVVLGDSFGTMWGEALTEWADQNSVSGLFMARTGCPPLDGLGSFSKPECEPANKARFEYLRSTSVKKVVLIAAWGNIFFSGKESFYDSSETTMRPKQKYYRQGSLLYITLERTVKRLKDQGYQVFVMDLQPGDPSDESPYGPAIASLRQHGAAITFPIETLNQDPMRQEVHATLVDLQKMYGFTILDPVQILCPQGRCLIAQDGYPVSNDQGGHLTTYGSKKSVAVFAPLLKP